MAARRRSPRKAPRRAAHTPKSKSLGTPREQRIRRERRNLGANINYQYWIIGYQDREAARTGKRPSESAVLRDKRFQQHVDTILGHDPKRTYKTNSGLARALVAVGARDPNYKGNVGNSPGRGQRQRRRQSKRRSSHLRG